MHLLLLATPHDPSAVLPALALLAHHTVATAPPPDRGTSVEVGPQVDVVVIDGRGAPDDACSLAAEVTTRRPAMVVVDPWTVRHVGEECAVVQLVLADAGPAEVDARLRLAAGVGDDAGADGRPRAESRMCVGSLCIDLREHRAEFAGGPLALTRREFDLLAELAAHAGRTLTRRHLLWRVWGPDYEGGARTVDVHVRQIRAALGPAHAAMIRTVRGSGYVLVPEPATRAPAG